MDLVYIGMLNKESKVIMDLMWPDTKPRQAEYKQLHPCPGMEPTSGTYGYGPKAPGQLPQRGESFRGFLPTTVSVIGAAE